MSEIDDPIKLMAFCNRKIGELETLKGKAEGITEIIKIEYAIEKYSELLEKGIHQAYQQGRIKKDITDKTRKRFDA